MIPTPRAEQLAIPVRAALDGFQHAHEPAEFEPSVATNAFRVVVDNYSAIVLVGRLVSHIAKSAPGVTMDFRPSGTLSLPDLLDRAEIDLAIGPSTQQGERFSYQSLLQDDFVAMLRKNHPATTQPTLSINTFAAIPHLEISSVHHETDFIDKVLARRKLKRRIALRAPFLSAIRILATSDMVAVLPRRMAEELVLYRPLVIRPLSLLSPAIETGMIWPRRLDDQRAHRWLRTVVAKVAGGDLRAP